MNEAELRDFLANDLSLIEPGLKLVAKEYTIRSTEGAAGRIDLLAKDRFGNLVVIELKRSDAVARTAVHELFKYLALLQSEKALPPEKLRCVLLSTTWHELLVPFSKIARTSPYTIEGRRLLLAGSVPSGTEVVKLLQQDGKLRFPDSFASLTFATREDCHDVAQQLLDLLPKVGLSNVVLVELSAKEGRDLSFEHSLAMPIFPMTRDEALTVLDQTHFPIKLLSDFGDVDLTASGDLSALRDAVESSLQSELFCLPGVCEPHLLLRRNFAAERDLWKVEAVHRFGPAVSDTMLLTDEDILERLAGADGENDLQFVRAVDPTHKMQFADFARHLRRYLARYGWWKIAKPVLQRATETRGASVVAHAYCPNAFLQHMALFLRNRDASWLPAFELIVGSPDGYEHLSGFLAWDGVTPPAPLDEVLADRGSGGNVLRLVMSERKHQRAIVTSYGFVFPVLRRSSRDGEPKPSCEWRPIGEWLSQHAEAATELAVRLGPVVQL